MSLGRRNFQDRADKRKWIVWRDRNGARERAYDRERTGDCRAYNGALLAEELVFIDIPKMPPTLYRVAWARIGEARKGP